jgi:integrase
MNSFARDENGKYVWDINLEETRKRKKRKPITEEEVQTMLKDADKNKSEYFKLRNKAAIAIPRVFGKRRSEIASVEMDNVQIINNELAITFILRKKRKRGLFQFMEYCKEKDPTTLSLPLPIIKEKWRAWQDTEHGHSLKEMDAFKSVDISSPYAIIIRQYWEYIKSNLPSSKFLFPLVYSNFGNYKFNSEKHIDGDGLYRAVKSINPNLWMHLFRELVGGETALKYGGRSIEGVYAVKRKLNLEKEETAWNYIDRAIPDKMET